MNYTNISFSNNNYKKIHNGSCELIITVSFPRTDSLLTIIYGILALFIITSNITLMAILPRIKQELTRFERMFMLLSLSDLMVGLVQMPYQIFLIYRSGDVTCLQVAVKTMFSILFSMSSGLLTFQIMNERYVFLTRENLHSKLVKTKNTLIVIVSICMTALAWAGGGIYVSLQSDPHTKWLFLFVYGCFGGLLLVEAVIINIMLFHSLRQNNANGIRKVSTTSTNYINNANITILTISVILIVSYLPIFTSLVYASVRGLRDPESYQSRSDVLMWIVLPVNLNSALNSTVFMIRKKEFRDYFKDLFSFKTKVTIRNQNYDLIDHLAGNLMVGLESDFS